MRMYVYRKMALSAEKANRSAACAKRRPGCSGPGRAAQPCLTNKGSERCTGSKEQPQPRGWLMSGGGRATEGRAAPEPAPNFQSRQGGGRRSLPGCADSEQE
ncbi:hypothetical protein NDU88_001147 [Pleurodeles waltl]|uniref:Uncharacterized protein n=1 Tax=Pleurodeles waltl TaxID=8319 RepID=A0AAV7S912_PLEWA|nr:hypothetical protein NDU88_001147 [Pleurodeles waltl]